MKKLVDQVLDFEEHRDIYSDEEQKKIAKSLRIKITKKLSALAKEIRNGIDDVNYF